MTCRQDWTSTVTGGESWTPEARLRVGVGYGNSGAITGEEVPMHLLPDFSPRPILGRVVSLGYALTRCGLAASPHQSRRSYVSDFKSQIPERHDLTR